MAATGAQWVQPMGYKHALAETAVDILRHCADPFDSGAMVEAIRTTDLTSLVGHVNFATGPVPNVCSTPVVGGQWTRGQRFPFDIAIAENQQAPEIPVDAPFHALE